MIYVITGAPCSGKSTYIREHASKGDLIVDFDLIAEAFGAEPHKAEGSIQKAAVRARRDAIEVAKTSDSDCWIVDTIHREAFAEDEEVIELDPGKDVCVDRAMSDCRPEGTIEEIENWYNHRKGRAMKKHLYKNFALKTDEGAGTISGYFSTYDRIPDSYGDVIEKGAFTETIEARKESGHPFPLCWNHDLNQIIGAVDTIEDDEHGPLMTAHFFDTALAQEKRELVKQGVVYQFSFAYDVKGWERPTEEEEKAGIMNILTKLDLFEVSIVPIPANPRAEVTDIKSGRRNSKKDAEAIKQAIALLQGVLHDADDDDGKDDPKGNSKEEDSKSRNLEKNQLLEYINNMIMED